MDGDGSADQGMDSHEGFATESLGVPLTRKRITKDMSASWSSLLTEISKQRALFLDDYAILL